jgi:hypothetical protein
MIYFHPSDLFPVIYSRNGPLVDHRTGWIAEVLISKSVINHTRAPETTPELQGCEAEMLQESSYRSDRG